MLADVLWQFFLECTRFGCTQLHRRLMLAFLETPVSDQHPFTELAGNVLLPVIVLLALVKIRHVQPELLRQRQLKTLGF